MEQTKEQYIEKLIAALDNYYSTTIEKLNAGDAISFTKFVIEYVRLLKPPVPEDNYLRTEELKEKIHQHFKEKFIALNLGTFCGLLDQMMCNVFLEMVSMNKEDQEKLIPKPGLSDEEMEVYRKQVEVLLIQKQNLNYYRADPETSSPVSGSTGKKLKRSKTDEWTVLSLEETVLLADFLKTARVILPDEKMLSKVKLSEALSVLTGFSAEALRQGLSSIPNSRDISKEKLQNIQKALHQVNALIERKLK